MAQQNCYKTFATMDVSRPFHVRNGPKSPAKSMKTRRPELRNAHKLRLALTLGVEATRLKLLDGAEACS